MNVFNQMFQLQVNPLKPTVIDMNKSHRWEISAIIGVTGEMKGGVSIRMNRALCRSLLAKAEMKAKDEAEEDRLIHSVTGEVANIIAGNALSLLSDRNVQLTSPLVVQGTSHRIVWPQLTPTICVPFRSAHGSFEVGLCLQKVEPA